MFHRSYCLLVISLLLALDSTISFFFLPSSILGNKLTGISSREPFVSKSAISDHVNKEDTIKDSKDYGVKVGFTRGVSDPDDIDSTQKSHLPKDRPVSKNLATKELGNVLELLQISNDMTQEDDRESTTDTKDGIGTNSTKANNQDLNGIHPISPFLSACTAAALAFCLWQVVIFLVALYTRHPIESEYYYMRRIFFASRTILLGLTTLASGFSAMCGLGLLGLSVQVAYGVYKGELDPNAEHVETAPKRKMPNPWDLMMLNR